MTIDNSIASKNARATSRGDYSRWLAQRFGSIDLMSTKEGQDKVSLKKIYVPVRIGTESTDENKMSDPSKAREEAPLGDDARDIIAKQAFTAISGRPGSGKTTLTQALIHEVCHEQQSQFRNNISHFYGERTSCSEIDSQCYLKKGKGILPAPLILRNYQNELENIESFDQLLSCWWQKSAEEAADKNKYKQADFNTELLAQSIDRFGDDIPLLLIFDGIDEVGGLEMRNKVFRLALQAVLQGHKVVVTGRPTGFSGLDLTSTIQSEDFANLVNANVDMLNVGNIHDVNSNLVEFNSANKVNVPSLESVNNDLFGEHKWLYQVQPFSYPEIQMFINRFYLVLDEWKSKREQGIEKFTEALINPRRSYLLTLARRPIFLTLMSLVHVNDTQMPYGRADLYKRIIDLYLMRQTLQRRIKANTAGKDIPQWDEREIRRALGYLAWRSQITASEIEGADDETEKRQVIWSKADLKVELANLLKSEVGGRFDIISPAQADDLLAYFLHPAGLLVEPAEEQIQFSHLSFQEYLCAEYLHGRTSSKGSKRFIKEVKTQLFSQLTKPGWDEVGVLFFTIHASIGEQSESVAHFELLAALDATVAEQAKLLMTVYTGYELPFTSEQRSDWLPLAIASCLIHPRLQLPETLRIINNSSTDGDIKIQGKELLLDLFAMDNTCGVIEALEEKAKQSCPEGFFDDDEDDELGVWFKEINESWKTPADSNSWDVIDDKTLSNTTPINFAQNNARQQSLLYLANSSLWLSEKVEESDNFIIKIFGEISIVNDENGQQTISQWLQRNNVDFIFDTNKPNSHTATISNALYELDSFLPQEGQLLSTSLSLIPIDFWLTQGESLSLFQTSSLTAVSLSLNGVKNIPARTKLSISLYQLTVLVEQIVGKAYFPLLEARSSLREELTSKSFYQSSSRSRSQARSMFQGGLHNRSMLRSVSESTLAVNFKPETKSKKQLLKLLRKRSNSDFKTCLGNKEHAVHDEIITLITKLENKKQVNYTEEYGIYLSLLSLHYAAKDWFNEQIDDIERTQLQGGRVGEPLPKSLGFFDGKGMPLAVQSRTSLLRLMDWVNDEDAILAFVFPNHSEGGLSQEDEKILRLDLARLKKRAWSLQNIVKTVLDDWPENQVNKDFSTARYEQDFIEECNRLLLDT